MKHERGVQPKRARYVLPTESAAQFESEQLAFEKALKPRDKIEQMYVEDLAYHDRKMSERRRIAFAILKAAQTEALFCFSRSSWAHVTAPRRKFWSSGGPKATAMPRLRLAKF